MPNDATPTSVAMVNPATQTLLAHLASLGATIPRDTVLAIPEHWTIDTTGRFVEIVARSSADDHRGGVISINERTRGFGLGIPAQIPGDTVKYKGRGWQVRLYQDAIAELAGWQLRTAARVEAYELEKAARLDAYELDKASTLGSTKPSFTNGL